MTCKFPAWRTPSSVQRDPAACGAAPPSGSDRSGLWPSRFPPEMETIWGVSIGLKWGHFGHFFWVFAHKNHKRIQWWRGKPLFNLHRFGESLQIPLAYHSLNSLYFLLKLPLGVFPIFRHTQSLTVFGYIMLYIPSNPLSSLKLYPIKSPCIPG